MILFNLLLKVTELQNLGLPHLTAWAIQIQWIVR